MSRGFLFLVIGFFAVSWTEPDLALADSPSPAQAWIQKAQSLNLPTHPQWLRLIHYQTRWWGGYQSQADGLNFFSAGQPGITDPAAELNATIQAFFDAHPIDLSKKEQHPICRFPARFRWLAEQLEWKDSIFPVHDCSRWLEFQKKLAAKSVTLVFSNYFLNSPASAFGHSFLRVNKTPSGQAGERYELLDYGINYAANLDTDNPLVYGFKGLLGLFHGTFTSVPYFYKVREYNDSESRDLWEYDLNLQPGEVERLVAHSWEMGSTYFDYWYLDENCSYHMMTLLDAAAPRLQLAERLKTIVIPADTIRVAAETPNLIHSVRFRPSIRTQFLARWKLLDYDQQMIFKKLIQDWNPDGIKQPQVLDAASDYLDLNHFNQTLDPKSPASRWKDQILTARASLGGRTPNLNIPPPTEEQPEVGHRSSRIGLDFENREQTISTGIQYRIALHDKLDPHPGYPDTSEMGFLNTRLEWLAPQRKLRLDRFALIEASTFNPLGGLFNRPSWSIRVATDRDIYGLCENCLNTGLDLNAGAAWGIAGTQDHPTVLGWAMASTAVRYSPSFEASKWVPGLGPEFGTRIRLHSRWNLAVTATGRYQGLGIPGIHVTRHWGVLYRVETRIRIFDQWALNIRITQRPAESTERFAVGLYRYF